MKIVMHACYTYIIIIKKIWWEILFVLLYSMYLLGILISDASSDLVSHQINLKGAPRENTTQNNGL